MSRRSILRTLTISAALGLTLGYAFAAAAQTISVLVAYHSATGNTEKMAQGVADGIKSVAGAIPMLKRVGDIAPEELLSADAVVVGSPVYFTNMSAEVKTFLEKWSPFFAEKKMRNKVGAAFATGGSFSNGKELTMVSILGAMLIHQMIIVSAGGAFGASATTGPDSPGIDERELAEANALGKRIAQVAIVVKRGSSQ